MQPSLKRCCLCFDDSPISVPVHTNLRIAAAWMDSSRPGTAILSTGTALLGLGSYLLGSTSLAAKL